MIYGTDVYAICLCVNNQTDTVKYETQYNKQQSNSSSSWLEKTSNNLDSLIITDETQLPPSQAFTPTQNWSFWHIARLHQFGGGQNCRLQ